MTTPAQPTIAYLWDADYPWDVRTEKVCRTLVEAGFGVEIIARNSAWKPETEALPEGRVSRMRPWRALGRRLDNLLAIPAPLNPRWSAHLGRVLRTSSPKLLIVRDLPLAPTALWAARRHRIPVVLDMAENYPAMIEALRDSGSARPMDWLLRNPRMITAVERYIAPRVDHIITVVEESSQRMEGLGVPPARLTVVSNTPSRSRIAPARSSAEAQGPLRLVYLGLMEAPRGLIEVIEAVAELRAEGRAIEALLIGGGRDLARFEARAAALGLEAPTLRFTGALPNAQALEMVAASQVGLVPHHAVETWNTTIPNKLFDYMAAGLPVVSSNAVPAERIVRATGSGVVFRSGDARDLAEQMRPLFDPGTRAKYATAGQRAIRDRYNWEHDTATLLDLVRRLINR